MELTPSETKEILRDLINRNIELSKEGKKSVALAIYGKPGIAKTSIVEQVAKEFEINFIKENVAEKEVGDQ